jgi:hypothetical protein
VSADRLDLVCECRLDGEIIRGDVLDLSHAGFVMETTVPFEPDCEFDLRLVGGAASQPIYIRGAVEARIAHAVGRGDGQLGVRFRLLHFSNDYAGLITGSSSAQHESESRAGLPAPRRERGEREWLSSLLGSGPEASPPAPATQTEHDPEEWEPYSPLSERAGTPLWPEGSLAPEALVIDDGELEDVASVLAELGVEVERKAPNGDSILPTWLNPEKLLVVTAKRALKLRLPLQSVPRSFVAIAVADSDARMMYSALRRLGFDYTISRPIHPLAMSMLLRQAVFTHDDQRHAPRKVLGCSVRWWCGWERKRTGVILDLSPTGCQLLVRGSAPRRSAIKIRIPAAVAGGRRLTLAGEVVRSTPGHGQTRLGISFDPLSTRQQARLQKMLTLPGPCRLTGDPSLPEGERPKRREEEPQAAQHERRRKRRGTLQQEVVALEHGSVRVKHLLVSSDLSIDGMRVEAQPALALDEQLDLALYEDSELDPLLLSARVARDDGRRGWWLRFVGVTPEIEQRLAKALDRFPPVTRLDESDPEACRVILGQVLADQEELEEAEFG